MSNSNFSNAARNSQDSDDNNEREMLLADLTGEEAAEIFFEGLSDREAGMGQTLERLKPLAYTDGGVTGGDVDDDWYQAEVVGEEAVGGQNPTPDQNVTEDLLHSMGISSREGYSLESIEQLAQRDRGRWELDPNSSEDYEERL